MSDTPKRSPALDCRWLGIRRSEKESATSFYYCGNFLERIGLFGITCCGCTGHDKRFMMNRS